MQSKIRKPLAVLIGGIVILASGCHANIQPTSENLTKGLNAYYSTHKDCLFPSALRFPYEVSPGSEEKKTLAQMEALADAGLLESKEDKTIKVNVYTPTPVGERAGGRFCYGHREITSIDNFTAPAKNSDGFLETQVDYHYKIVDVPVWAKTDKMLKAFPDLAKAISSGGTGKAKLANAGAGWQIPS